MTMARTIFIIIFCTAVDGAVGKHIYVSDRKNWTEAQAYCRTHYTDLSFVSSQSDEDKLREAADISLDGWIGLYLDPSDAVWKWSGGGIITYQNWADGQPDNNFGTETRGQIWPGGFWNDANEGYLLRFFCIGIVVEQIKMPWEEALDHCKRSEANLISLNSETEFLLTQREVHKHNINRVWIGLRYLGDRWLWVNGDPLGHQAWPPAGHDHQCPAVSRCGALTKDGQWENRDCQEALSFICE